ncbi:MAG: hypothetical protein SNG38_06290 [Rikenellaceae bacterium]
MLTINPTLYEQLAQLLTEAIDGRGFYSDKIYFEDNEYDYLFTATLMIYYRECDYPEGIENHIDNIIPIWWEFHSTAEEGERLNDFDFSLLNEAICR